MRICEKYLIPKSQLLNTWYLSDIFDAIEYLDIKAEVEHEHSLEIERKSKK